VNLTVLITIFTITNGYAQLCSNLVGELYYNIMLKFNYAGIMWQGLMFIGACLQG
jgi:hypothetical protein